MARTDRKRAAPGVRRDRMTLIVTFGLGIVALSVSGGVLAYARHEAKVARALEDHGAITGGRWLRGEISVSSGTDSDGRRDRPTRREVYAYRVQGRDYEVRDRGATGGEDAFEDYRDDRAPREGMPRAALIVYLPERPDVARLRIQLDPETGMLLLFASLFGVAGLLSIAGGWWMAGKMGAAFAQADANS